MLKVQEGIVSLRLIDKAKQFVAMPTVALDKELIIHYPLCIFGRKVEL